MFELSPEMISVITVLVMFATQTVKIYRAKGGKPLTKKQLVWGTMFLAAAIGLPWGWQNRTFEIVWPVIGDDPAAFLLAVGILLQELVNALLWLIGAMVFFYRQIAKPLFEGIGFVPLKKSRL